MNRLWAGDELHDPLRSAEAPLTPAAAALLYRAVEAGRRANEQRASELAEWTCLLRDTEQHRRTRLRARIRRIRRIEAALGAAWSVFVVVGVAVTVLNLGVWLRR